MPIPYKVTIFFAANGVIMTTFAVMAAVFYFFGADIENAVVGPVVKFDATTKIFRGYVTNPASKREVEVACFTLHIEKKHQATPLKYAFFVEARLSDLIPASAYLADDHHFKAESDLQTHPVGQRWSRDYCFEMPGTIADSQDIRVSGYAEHQRHSLWHSITHIPPFVIPAL